MIHEVDEALRRLVREQALRGTDVEVAFDAPTKDWAARRNKPTVNLYLYDIREDLRRRERGLINENRPDGTVAARHRPPRYLKLSYLLTAWTQRPEDEHRLLSDLLRGFLRYEALPAALLAGSLAALRLPVPLTVALPPPEDRAFADVWSALGGELKPSLDVVVAAAIQAGDPIEAGPPATGGMRLDLAGDDSVGHEVRREPPPGDHPGRAGAGDRPAQPDVAGGGGAGGAGAGRRVSMRRSARRPAP